MKKTMILLLIIAIVAMLSMFMMTTSGLLSVNSSITQMYNSTSGSSGNAPLYRYLGGMRIRGD